MDPAVSPSAPGMDDVALTVSVLRLGGRLLPDLGLDVRIDRELTRSRRHGGARPSSPEPVRLARQPAHQRLSVHRPSEVEALARIAAKAAEQLQLLVVLDPFGDR